MKDYFDRSLYMNRSVVAAFLVNIVAFGVFLTQQLIHNHVLRMPYIPWNDQLQHGRWFNVPLLFLLDWSDTPVLMPLLGIILSLATAVLVLRLWSFPRRSGWQSILLILLTAYPAYLAFFYYTYQTPLFFVANLFAVLCVVATRNPGRRMVLVAAVSATFMFASYQPALSVLAAVGLSGLLIDLCTSQPLREALSRLLRLMLATIAGAIVYVASIKLAGVDGVQALQVTEVTSLPQRVLDVIYLSFKHLVITQPEFPLYIRLLLLAILFGAIGMTINQVRSDSQRRLIVIATWLLLIIATKAMFFVSQNSTFYEYRYNTAQGFLYAFAMAAVARFTTSVWMGRAWLVLAIFIATRYVQMDLVRQSVLLRGQQHDLAIANRVLARIESLPEIDFSRTYDLVRIGNWADFRPRLLRSRGRDFKAFGDTNMDLGDISAIFADEQVFMLLGSRVRFQVNSADPAFRHKIVHAMKHRVHGRRGWPAPESVFVEDDTIYIYLLDTYTKSE